MVLLRAPLNPASALQAHAGLPEALRRCRAWLLAGTIFALAGCAQLVPQTMALRSAWPAAVEQSVEIADVPFFPQDDYQCGPAALATILVHSGVEISPEQLVPQVYLPARRGSLQVEMLAAARRQGRVAYVLAPRYGDLLREVGSGTPVLVLQDVGAITQQWHYAVVNGFDYPSGTILLRSGTVRRFDTSFTAFERTWMKSGYWAMVATAPDRIPQTATEEAWIDAVLAMSRVAPPAAVTAAWSSALQRWPDNLAAAVGLANQHHTAGALTQAEAVLREALVRNPQSIIVLNNLAQVLLDQGRPREALALADRAAADPQSPFAAEARATRDSILQRLGPSRVAAP